MATLCESIVRFQLLLIRISQRKHLNNVTCIFVAFFFSIQTVAGSGYYGIESPLRYMRNLKTRHFFELLSAACWLSRANGSQNSF